MGSDVDTLMIGVQLEKVKKLTKERDALRRQLDGFPALLEEVIKEMDELREELKQKEAFEEKTAERIEAIVPQIKTLREQNRKLREALEELFHLPDTTKSKGIAALYDRIEKLIKECGGDGNKPKEAENGKDRTAL